MRVCVCVCVTTKMPVMTIMTTGIRALTGRGQVTHLRISFPIPPEFTKLEQLPATQQFDPRSLLCQHATSPQTATLDHRYHRGPRVKCHITNPLYHTGWTLLA